MRKKPSILDDYTQYWINKSKTRIQLAEKAREEGHTEIAIDILRSVIEEAKNYREMEIAAETLGHLIVCYQHFADRANSEDEKADYLSEMFDLCTEGLEMEVSNDRKSVFYLRLGCYHMRVNQPGVAALAFYEALQMHAQRDAVYYEYQGHHASALCAAGCTVAAVAHLEESIKEIKNDRKLRGFHRLTILAGLHMRLMEAAKTSWKPFLLISSTYMAWKYARELNYRFKQPLRLQQLKRGIFGR